MPRHRGYPESAAQRGKAARPAPLMAKEKIDRRQSAAFYADTVTKVAYHRCREHNTSGCRQHTHYKRYHGQCQSPAAEKTLHCRHKAGGDPCLAHCRADYIDK